MNRANSAALRGILILSTFALLPAAGAPAKKPAPTKKSAPAKKPTLPPPLLPKGPLFDAVRAADAKKVIALLAAGELVNAVDAATDQTPLMYATETPDTGVITALVEGGADVNQKNKIGETVFMHLAWKGKPEQLQLLMAHGADMKATSILGTTALHYAAIGDPRNVSLLLDHAADPNTKDLSSNTPLAFLALVADRSTPHLEAARLLIQKGADVNGAAAPGKWFTPLQAAVKQDNPELVKLLLASGADVDRIGAQGMTALMTAAIRGEVEMAKILLAGKANVNAVGPDKDNALAMAVAAVAAAPADAAATLRRHQMLHLLIDSGADVNAPVLKQRVSVLMLAASYGDTAVVQMLLENGADVNAHGTSGTTALKLATKHNHIKIIKLLQKAGATE